MTIPITLVLGSLLILQVSVAQGKAQFSSSAVDPCLPSPCGPGAQCSVNSAGAAICRCQPGYFPKPDTITGCGPQCSQDYECRSTEKCQANKCVPTCGPSPCGVNAECESVNHKAVCRCPRGYTGDPLFQCTQQAPIARAIVSHPPPQVIRVTDPCSPNPCGVNADCRVSADRPVCTCLPGHQGNPLTSCRRGECSSDSECPHHNVCENYHCVNPCTNKCGANAHCDVRNHVAVCSCPPGYTGNPTTGCRRYDPNEACRACGQNTNCRVEGERAICSCKPGFFGDPLRGCRHECESDYDCSGNLACIDFKCKNPCAGACGTLANCEIRNHRAVCSCPKDYLGDPYTRCYPECTTHSECAPHLACIGLKCKDPCIGACGINAECRVDKYNHKAICSCPKGYTGHPFSECRRQTPAAGRLCESGRCPQVPASYPMPARLCESGRCPQVQSSYQAPVRLCESGRCPEVQTSYPTPTRLCESGRCPQVPASYPMPARLCESGRCPQVQSSYQAPVRLCESGRCPQVQSSYQAPVRLCESGRCPEVQSSYPTPSRLCESGNCPQVSASPQVPDSPQTSVIRCESGRCPQVQSSNQAPVRLCESGRCPEVQSSYPTPTRLRESGNCPQVSASPQVPDSPQTSVIRCESGRCPQVPASPQDSIRICESGRCPQ